MDDTSADCILTGAHGPVNSTRVCPDHIPLPQVPSLIKLPSKSHKKRSVQCHLFGCTNNLFKTYDKCSCFHPLAEFDGDRRNCRQRLKQHNRRQRRLRVLRRPKSQDVNEEQQNVFKNSYRESPRPAVSDEPQLVAPNLSEIATRDDILLSSVDIDSLLSSHSKNSDGQNLEEHLLPEMSSSLLSVTADGDNLVMAEDIWNDQWLKDALGHLFPEVSLSSYFLADGSRASDVASLGVLYL